MKNLPSDSLLASWNMTKLITILLGEKGSSYRQRGCCHADVLLELDLLLLKEEKEQH